MPRFLIVSCLLVLLFAGCATSKTPGVITPLPIFDTMWDYQHPDSTEARFAQILQRAENRRDPAYNASYHAQLLTQIARSQGLQGNIKQAHATLDAAEKLLTAETKPARMRYLLERGRVYNAAGQSETAKEYFLLAWELGREAELEYYALDAVHMLGIVDLPEKQLEWNLKALQIAEEAWDKRCKGWLGPLYNNIGWTYHDRGEYTQALYYFEKGLQWRRSMNDTHGTRIAKWTVARAQRSLGSIDIALQMQLELLDEINTHNLPPDGYVHEELGELYLLAGDTATAKFHFAKAWELLAADPWLLQNEASRLQRLKELSN